MVKYFDFWRTNDSESKSQKCFHLSRTKVWGSKTIRYRRSPDHKLCRPNFMDLNWGLLYFKRNQSFCVLGGIWSQGENLKELTEGHYQAWSLRLNLTQRGKTYQVLTFEMIEFNVSNSRFNGWWCMTVLSWWFALSG